MLRTAIVAVAAVLAVPVLADTTDVTWRQTVTIEKQGAHCVDDPNCFNRYHPAIPPAARAKPGDEIVFHKSMGNREPLLQRVVGIGTGPSDHQRHTITPHKPRALDPTERKIRRAITAVVGVENNQGVVGDPQLC